MGASPVRRARGWQQNGWSAWALRWRARAGRLPLTKVRLHSFHPPDSPDTPPSPAMASLKRSGNVRQVDGSARLTGPVAGPPGIIMAGFDLGQAGYTLEEFFLESAAACFEPSAPTGP